MPSVVQGKYANKHAFVDIEIRGIAEKSLKLQGLVDTGFTGFVHLPIQYAYALGLPLAGTITSTLADARQVTEFIAVGNVSVNGRKQTGVIVLAAGSKEVLVGMQFLRTFQFGLYLTDEDVLLFDSPRTNHE